jgi:hypothetical protein
MDLSISLPFIQSSDDLDQILLGADPNSVTPNELSSDLEWEKQEESFFPI